MKCPSICPVFVYICVRCFRHRVGVKGGDILDCTNDSGFERLVLSPLNAKKVNALIDAISKKDIGILTHSENVSKLACALAKAARASRSMLIRLRKAALLHDVGKIHIDDAILFKKEDLTDDEKAVIRAHPVHGYRMVRALFGYREVANIILEHHERYDGTGYPNGIRGEDIRFGARVIAICDAYDAMTNGRPYAEAMDESDAINELTRCKGTQFDATLVDLFVEMKHRNRPPT
jgi:putative nucleotidyltransferase with HDIG domain